ncbi:DUF433 domain-containing protein [Polaromonas sp. C04]|uniref:DUF433 domain-containing protein n=1 Tax=Polaromonas sp. C04 TaxID=1945857 RepID=UPI000987981A|nr:DUF433 domain-containing protein [Polaromonas sp. C04]OOG55330.1 hypothetical protein B0E49_07635 [Polaromonas sp. C04]
MMSSAIRVQPVPFGVVPCFAGTQIPVKSMFDYLEAGETLDEYLEQYPSVTHTLAVKVLEDSCKSLLSS